jgi:large subunit ribosomal protein L23
MNPTDVIVRPIITEKSTVGMEDNRYTFQVDRRADKQQIRDAVQTLYGVRVLKVHTQNRRGQMRRNRFGHWKANAMKRAVVKIHPEDKIDLF